MTLLVQRIRDAQTILEARWRPELPPLSPAAKDAIAAIMVDYAIQCELKALRREDEWRSGV
jgi:hypothetical protein